MAAIQAQVRGVGLIGPGLSSWDAALASLRGDAAHQGAPTVVPPVQRLPAAERRRAGAAVKIALAVADAACMDADIDPRTIGSVFASSSGDGANCHALCESLASENPADRLLSPTRFTNSVHNAASGYWHIAVGSRHASSSLCAYDESFAAGLIAALTQMRALSAPLLLVASEAPYPQPLQSVRPLPDSMGVALVLEPAESVCRPASKALLSAQLLPLEQCGPATRCHDASLEDLRRRSPAARALPLLEAIARRKPASVVLRAQAPLALRVDLEFE